MNVQDDPNSWAVQKFAIGQPVPRTEDPVLVQGRGRYTDDVSLPGQAYAAMVRSRHAHGVLKAEGVDLDRIYTVNDLITSNDVSFAATGITSGELLDGVEYTGRGARTHSVMMRSRTGTIRYIEAYHRWQKH
jgi:fructose-1,6-bisphosphatase/sedoheptulose 1,7-bisphosphatase-like protein